MYNQISEKFKKESKITNFYGAFFAMPLLVVLILAMIVGFSKWDPMSSFYSYIILLLSFVIGTILFLYIFILFLLKKEKQFKWKNIWRIKSNIQMLMKAMHQKDIELLINILKSQGVNTRPKVLEILRHYQCLLPRRTVAGTQIISICALIISMIALFFQDKVFYSQETAIAVTAIIFGSILIYIILWWANKNILRVLGEDALIERIEMAVSEIWIKSLIK